MTDKQREIFTTRKKEWSKMLEQIEAVNISEKWTGIFTALCLDRGFRRLKPEQLGQMQHIAEIDRQSIGQLPGTGRQKSGSYYAGAYFGGDHRRADTIQGGTYYFGKGRKEKPTRA